MEIPAPSAVSIITITTQSNLHCSLNLDIIERTIPLNHEIISVRLTRADAVTTEFSPAPASKDFSNQCTMVIALTQLPTSTPPPTPPPPSPLVNMKIFGTGLIIMTGAKDLNHCYLAIEIIKKYLHGLNYDYQINPKLTQLGQIFQSSIEYSTFLSRNYLVILKLFEILGFQIDLQLDRWLNTKYLVHDISLDFPSQPHWQKYLNLLQVLKIIHLQLGAQIDNIITNDLYLKRIKLLMNGEVVNFPVTDDKDNEGEVVSSQTPVQVDNYNTLFKRNFAIDLEQFTRIINDRYLNVFDSARKPPKYRGILIKYISRVNCQPGCQIQVKKKNKIQKSKGCHCKMITFMIFQEGSIMIAGSCSWEQVQDGYSTINRILENEYHNILIKREHSIDKFTQEVNDLKLPIVVTNPKVNLCDSNVVWFNRAKVVVMNPSNYQLISQFGQIQKYLPQCLILKPSVEPFDLLSVEESEEVV
jgi:TATA-box binding protein (TBP) (component of TFIID and TFIIIB)